MAKNKGKLISSNLSENVNVIIKSLKGSSFDISRCRKSLVQRGERRYSVKRKNGDSQVQREGRKKAVTCYSCGKTGHIFKRFDCPAKGKKM